MRGGEAPVPRSSTGQDGDTGSVPAAVGGLPLSPWTPLGPGCCCEGRPRPPPSPGALQDTLPTPWDALEGRPLPHPNPCELYLCTCVRYGPSGGQPCLSLVSLSWCWALPGSPHTRELLPRPHPHAWGPILLPGCPLVSEGPTQRPNLGWEK